MVLLLTCIFRMMIVITHMLFITPVLDIPKAIAKLFIVKKQLTKDNVSKIRTFINLKLSSSVFRCQQISTMELVWLNVLIGVPISCYYDVMRH